MLTRQCHAVGATDPGGERSSTRRVLARQSCFVAWPDDWDERFSGAVCSVCDEGRPQETDHGSRVFEGRHIDAYISSRGAQRGYVVAIWRGGHATDLVELTPEELAGFWSEVVTVARAMRDHYRPRKVNYEVLGNQMPHIHAHITARFADGDVSPGRPLPSERNGQLPPDEVAADAQALRALFGHR